jgi:2-methylcitrate dehydratase PrpD
MLKDGSGWGAMAGVSAGMLAQKGFTGAPAITVEADDVADYWTDLGTRWLIMEQGFKGHAVCWWAQPAVEAAIKLVLDHDIHVSEIEEIEVYTFDKATRLAHPRPATTEEAQYSLPYPVAAALQGLAHNNDHGWYGLGPHQLLEDALNDESILMLADRVSLIEAPDLTAQFPGRFLARVKIRTQAGKVFESGETTFRGELDFPFNEAELINKYHWLSADILPRERIAAIEKAVFDLPSLVSIQPLIDLISSPPTR